METNERASYLTFQSTFSEMGCFSMNQIRFGGVYQVGRNTISRWVKEGKLIQLRQGMYAFPESKQDGDAPFYIANKLYAPSYISIHSALAFYGMIPEAVVQITSVSSRKTSFFENELGQFSYHTIKKEAMFGYTIERSAFHPTWGMLIAEREKAILDLLYLYPQYTSKQDMLDLRLDLDDIDLARLDAYTEQYGVKALERRVTTLKEAYSL